MQAELSDDERRALAGLRRFLFDASDVDPDPDAPKVIDAATDAAEQFNDLQERVKTLETTVERLEATASGPELSKREKHDAVMQAARNKASGGHGTALGYAEVQAAANVSRRYAYEIMETLAAQHEWARYDTSKQKNRLIIEPPGGDWDAVHTNTSER